MSRGPGRCRKGRCSVVASCQALTPNLHETAPSTTTQRRLAPPTRSVALRYPLLPSPAPRPSWRPTCACWATARCPPTTWRHTGRCSARTATWGPCAAGACRWAVGGGEGGGEGRGAAGPSWGIAGSHQACPRPAQCTLLTVLPAPSPPPGLRPALQRRVRPLRQPLAQPELLRAEQPGQHRAHRVGVGVGGVGRGGREALGSMPRVHPDLCTQPTCSGWPSSMRVNPSP